jgi:xanthine dehydrogenase YagR molybdenum-binding subunit
MTVVVDIPGIGHGRITPLDARAAKPSPGGISHENAPKLPYRDNSGSNNSPGWRLRDFQDNRVLIQGQPAAVTATA